IERWAEAVRAKDYDKILKDHAPDILMFDVPPPIQSKGTEEYKKTWDLFFSASPTPPIFDIKKLDITAGIDVAFATALMQCVVVEKSGDKYDLDFRLTVGLRKIDGRWTIVHEHHSIPAE
ncbi:MAG TPA: nuclear transport factor 2 family protein, partial [Pyrinomonadaceae bacterium]|nr:nuclear transport factor 2 family protein [Pyrinomonadaceae bacterium]